MCCGWSEDRHSRAPVDEQNVVVTAQYVGWNEPLSLPLPTAWGEGIGNLHGGSVRTKASSSLKLKIGHLCHLSLVIWKVPVQEILIGQYCGGGGANPLSLAPLPAWRGEGMDRLRRGSIRLLPIIWR